MKKESKHCSDMMKKDFNKEHVMIKEKMKILRTLLNVGFVIIFNIDGDVKFRDYCHTAGKYRDYAHRDCNIKVTLNHKNSIVFHNLKNYDSQRIMQELDKSDFKINVIPIVLEKYMSFDINNKLILLTAFNF